MKAMSKKNIVKNKKKLDRKAALQVSVSPSYSSIFRQCNNISVSFLACNVQVKSVRLAK